jgi:hypothetical protein
LKNAAQIGLMKTIIMVFGTTGIFTVLYLITGILLPQVPTLLIFCILGVLFLLPVEWFLILRQSKKDYGSYSLRSSLTQQEKPQKMKTFLYAFVLFGIVGICSFTISPLEEISTFSLREKLLSFLPIGFDWTDIVYIKSFSDNILIITCVV